MVEIYVVYDMNSTPEMWSLVQCVTCTAVQWQLLLLPTLKQQSHPYLKKSH